MKILIQREKINQKIVSEIQNIISLIHKHNYYMIGMYSCNFHMPNNYKKEFAECHSQILNDTMRNISKVFQ